MDNQLIGRVAFAVGTGRCGTKFLHEVFVYEADVATSHERNPNNEAFHRYCKWYDLPVDHLGFLRTKELEICDDLGKKDISFEASAHLSLSIMELYNYFSAKFILLVREPHKVINSYIQKGWYQTPIVYENKELVPGYQYGAEQIHRSMGRIIPTGESFEEWSKLSRVGKLSWYWNVLNEKVLEQFAEIPACNSMIVKLEELDYGKYQEICDFFSIKVKVKEIKFGKIVKRKPNKAPNKIPSLLDWSEREREEFETYVKPMAEKFNYEWRYNRILA